MNWKNNKSKDKKYIDILNASYNVEFLILTNHLALNSHGFLQIRVSPI